MRVILPLGSLFTRIKYVTVLIQVEMRLIHLLWNPILPINLRRKSHSILSYALLMSCFIVMKPILPFLLFFMWWRISNATRILSLIALFDWKALCDSEIISSRIFFNQFAKTFEINLYRMLHRAIRQNSVTCSGLLTFGISVMYLWFKPAGITPEFIQEITALVNGEQHIVHIIGDHLWNKLKDRVYFTRVRCSEQRVIIINNNICYIIFTRTHFTHLISKAINLISPESLWSFPMEESHVLIARCDPMGFRTLLPEFFFIESTK